MKERMRLDVSDRWTIFMLATLSAIVIAALVVMASLKPVHGQAITSTQLPAATITTGVANVSAVIIAPTNPGRRTFTICNGSGAAINVLPGTTAPTTASGIPIPVSTCLSPPANLLLSGSAGGGGNQWQAIATAAGPTIVAFIEW